MALVRLTSEQCDGYYTPSVMIDLFEILSGGILCLFAPSGVGPELLPLRFPHTSGWFGGIWQEVSEHLSLLPVWRYLRWSESSGRSTPPYHSVPWTMIIPRVR